MGAALANDGREIGGLLTRCGVQSRIAIEASSPTWAFVDRIVDHVGAVHVVDARKTRLKAGYAAKIDRLDAHRLADALRRDSVVGIYYPSPAIRDPRELCRYRCHPSRWQASLKQRMQALLLRHGVPVPVKGLFTARGTVWFWVCRSAVLAPIGRTWPIIRASFLFYPSRGIGFLHTLQIPRNQPTLSPDKRRRLYQNAATRSISPASSAEPLRRMFNLRSTSRRRGSRKSSNFLRRIVGCRY
jgi:hypothetical protein